jgi:DNA primase
VAVLVEGNFDVVSLHAHGVDNVCAPLGTAFTLEQAKLLRRFAPKVTLFFDADSAGKKATHASREACREAGLAVQVATPPHGKDPDELVRERGADGLRDVLKQSRGMLEHLIDEALDPSFIAADAYARAARVEQVAKLLAEEDDPIVRSMAKTYADRLAGRLDLVRSPEAFRALEAGVRRALAQKQREEGARPVDPRSARVAEKAPGKAQRTAIVGALIEYPELLEDPEVSADLNLLEGESARVAYVLAQCLRRLEPSTENDAGGQITLDTAGFLAQMPPAIQVFASRHLAAPEHASIEEAKEIVLMNATKLKDMLSRDASETMREMQHEEDIDKLEHLRELGDRARARLSSSKKTT